MSSPSFHVVENTLTFDLPVPRERAWRALTLELGRWWSPEHTAAGGRMSLDPRPGGALLESLGCEDEPGADGTRGGVLWAQVAVLVPGSTLELAGELSPAYGGPARTYHRFELQDGEAAGSCRLLFRDCVWGAPDASAGPTFAQGWDAILGGLVAHLA